MTCRRAPARCLHPTAPSCPHHPQPSTAVGVGGLTRSVAHGHGASFLHPGSACSSGTTAMVKVRGTCDSHRLSQQPVARGWTGRRPPRPPRDGATTVHTGRTVRHQHLPSSAAPTRFTSTIRDADGSKPTVRNRPPTVPGPKAPKPLVRLGVRTVRTVRTVPSPSPWHEGGTAPTRASVATAPTLARPPRGPWTVAAGRGLPCLRQGVLSHPPASACRARPLARRKVWATSYTAALLAQRAQVDREGLRPARPPGCASRSSR
jgi:hypothetical protein